MPPPILHDEDLSSNKPDHVTVSFPPRRHLLERSEPVETRSAPPSIEPLSPVISAFVKSPISPRPHLFSPPPIIVKLPVNTPPIAYHKHPRDLSPRSSSDFTNHLEINSTPGSVYSRNNPNQTRSGTTVRLASKPASSTSSNLPLSFLEFRQLTTRSQRSKFESKEASVESRKSLNRRVLVGGRVTAESSRALPDLQALLERRAPLGSGKITNSSMADITTNRMTPPRDGSPATWAQRRTSQSTSPQAGGSQNNEIVRPGLFANRTTIRGRSQQQLRRAVAAHGDDWTHWIELGILFAGFPSNVTTKDVWDVFSKEGHISTIELFDESKGNRLWNGRVRFCPPPAKPFWQDKYQGRRENGTMVAISFSSPIPPRRANFIASPVDSTRKYPETTSVRADYLDFGFMYERTTMMGMFRVYPTLTVPVNFQLKLEHRELEVSFQITMVDPQTPKKSDSPTGTHLEADRRSSRVEDYSFVIPLAQPLVMHKTDSDQKCMLVISTETPPNFFRKYPAEFTHKEDATFWSSRHTQFRQTDIMYDPRKLRTAALTLKKTKPIIDIGRWMTYHFVFDMRGNQQQIFDLMAAALRDFNVEVSHLDGFKIVTDREPAVWQYIDKPMRQKRVNSTALDELMAEFVPALSFPVRYQLEVCISEGYLNEHNLSKAFVDKLMQMDATKAQDMLEHVAGQKKRVYNPLKIFEITVPKGLTSKHSIPHYCTLVRSVTVTPSTMYFSTPSIETSNRVIRHYSEYADRFLRVRFTDEKFKASASILYMGRINANDGESMNEVFTRIKRALTNGITIGDRHFEFLASGNSQFREHGAYFFSPLPHLRVVDIRRWMGDFRDIKIVAKHAARLGQCFSTTRAINGTKVTIVEIEDVKTPDGTSIFTDGVGKISRFLAVMAASEVGVSMPTGEPPSAFQFRLGGCKGVLAVSPDPKMRELHIRHSQYKFPAIHEGLEIIRWSQFSAAHLNQQLILVLSALQVPDIVFAKKLGNQLSCLAQAMVDERMALNLLQKEIDPNQMTMTLASMVLDGFQRVREPFTASLLQLWRAWSIKYLKEKAKIVVHDGAILLGCSDETQTLKGHFDKLQHYAQSHSEEERLKSLPEIFVQMSRGSDGKPKVILGPMILARNPSLHPGDLRIVRGVDVPALRHLKDVVVLPQTGDRDIASMCSGGDLDGDDYVVIWDKELMPREWNHEPMDYTPLEPIEVEREVTTDDITSFFVTYMKNDSLPRIGSAHRATADLVEAGVKDAKCLELAAIHSQAVDYPKTGQPAIIPAHLKVRKWPHFMEKTHLPKDQTYVSEKILGKLYDQVERVDFVPDFDAPFDKRVLEAFDVKDEVLRHAEELKEDYDMAMHRLMAQNNISTEFEVWSTFVLQHANQSKDFKFHEEMGQMSLALKDRFRKACWDKAGGKEPEKIGPFVVAMYKVTSNQVAQALEESRQVKAVSNREVRARRKDPKSMPLISFPWIFHSLLGKIANGELTIGKEEVKDSPIPDQRDPKITTWKRPKTSPRLGLEEDVLETNEGITHRGEILELFHQHEEHHQTDASHLQTTVNKNELSGTDFSSNSEPDSIGVGEEEGGMPAAASVVVAETQSLSTVKPGDLIDHSSTGQQTHLAAKYPTREEEAKEEAEEEKEEVVIEFDEKPSLLEQLAQLTSN